MTTLNISDSYASVYARGPALRNYMLTYAFAVLAVTALWGGVGGVLIPLQVQQFAFAQYFAGDLASTDLTALAALKARIAAGAQLTGPGQQRLLDLYAAFEALRASDLAMIKVVAVAVTMVMQPLIGIASDRTRSRWGRRSPWIVAGTAAALAGLTFMWKSSATLPLLAGWIVAQAGITMVLGPLGATIVDRVPAALRGQMSAVAGIGLVFGFIGGIGVGGALAGRFGVDSYLIFATIALLFPVLFVALSPDSASKAMPVQAAGIGRHLLSCTYAFRDADFRWVWSARVILMFGYACSATYTVYMLQSYIQPGLSAAEAAKTVGLLNIAALPGTVLAMVVTGRWSDRIMRRTPFVIVAAVLLAASMAVPIFWATLPALYVKFIIGGIAFGIFLALDQALLIDVLPNKTDAAGRDLGLGQFASNLGSLLGPLLAGMVLSATGDYRLVWLAATLLALVSAVALMPVQRTR